MTMRSWSTASGARYFQAKETTWSTRILEVRALIRERKKMMTSVLATN
jgi:hypothetical protein